MHKFCTLILGTCLLAGCSQFTTSKQQAADLAAAATAQGDAYVDCVTQNALGYSGPNSGEISTVMTVATAACKSALDSYTAAQLAYLDTQVMLTEKPLEESVAALNERAKADIAQQLINKPAQTGTTTVATTAAATAAPASAAAAGTPVHNVDNATSVAATDAAAATVEWTPRQRIYLDCMTDQATKYSTLNESAAVVADVAQSRCRGYLRNGDTGLEQEGRALVMGAILDAKLAKP